MQKNLMHLSASVYPNGASVRLDRFAVDNVLETAGSIAKVLETIGDDLSTPEFVRKGVIQGITHTVTVGRKRIVVGLHEWSFALHLWGPHAGDLAIEHVDLVVREMIDNALCGNSIGLRVPSLDAGQSMFGIVDEWWPNHAAVVAKAKPSHYLRRFSTDSNELQHELYEDDERRKLDVLTYETPTDEEREDDEVTGASVRELYGPWHPVAVAGLELKCELKAA